MNSSLQQLKLLYRSLWDVAVWKSTTWTQIVDTLKAIFYVLCWRLSDSQVVFYQVLTFFAPSFLQRASDYPIQMYLHFTKSYHLLSFVLLFLIAELFRSRVQVLQWCFKLPSHWIACLCRYCFRSSSLPQIHSFVDPLSVDQASIFFFPLSTVLLRMLCTLMTGLDKLFLHFQIHTWKIKIIFFGHHYNDLVIFRNVFLDNICIN